MKSVLVVDDEELIRKGMAAEFERQGYKVDVAIDGRDALAKIEAHDFDLAVIDIIMPEKDGLETVRELQRLRPEMKIIAISGGSRRGSVDFLEVAREFGAHQILSKPFTRAQLHTAVERLLAQ